MDVMTNNTSAEEWAAAETAERGKLAALVKQRAPEKAVRAQKQRVFECWCQRMTIEGELRLAELRKRPRPKVRAEVTAAYIDARWWHVQLEVEQMPDAVIGDMAGELLGPGQRMPSRRALVIAIRRRRAMLEQSVIGAQTPLDLDLWPADALAARPHPGLRPLARARQRLLAALAAWKHLQKLDQQAAAAPSRMEELRKLKGAS